MEGRRQQILDLMGVEVWHFRDDSDPAFLQPPGADVLPADAGIQDTVASGHWLLTLSLPGEPGGVLVVRELSGNTESIGCVDRLTQAIASALGTGTAAACVIDARQAPDDAADPNGLPAPLFDALSRLQPELLISLGRGCGRWVTRALGKNGSADIRVLIADDPAMLLARPERKAALWRQFLSAETGNDPE